MNRASVTRTVSIPDAVRIDRFKRVPDLGPRILFFSGGSSLRSLSRRLTEYTHNSIHIICPFDSGGSSAVIRKAFNMLAVGDIRNRLNALADQTVHGNPEVYSLFAYRLPAAESSEKLRSKLLSMATGRDSLVTGIPNPMRRIIRNHIHSFLDTMPHGFDLRGANIGNILIAAGYLNNRRHIEPVIYMFSKLVEARGIVRPVTGLSYHLGAQLDSGKTVIGQHLLTGPAFAKLQSRVASVFLTKSLRSKKHAAVSIKRKIQDLIKSADLICYPFGSFYTSLIATLLPGGIGQAISETECPKVFIPNPSPDPEQFGMSLYDCVHTLVSYLKHSCGTAAPVKKLLQFVLIDSRSGLYPQPMQLQKIKKLGVQIIDTPLITDASRPLADDQKVIDVLLSLA